MTAQFHFSTKANVTVIPSEAEESHPGDSAPILRTALRSTITTIRVFRLNYGRRLFLSFRRLRASQPNAGGSETPESPGLL
jgi:hypothetical protein